jgi:hypothetical protein
VTHVWTRLSYETPAAAPSATQRIASASPLVVAGGSSAAATTTPTTSAAPSERPDQRRNTGSTSGAAPRAADTRVVTPPGVTQVSRTLSPARVMTTEVEPMYDREIVKLRAIVRERRSQLDPRTVAVLEQSIAVIDSAIAQSRAALAKDPASGFLATQLNHSLEKKVELLRTTALLPART